MVRSAKLNLAGRLPQPIDLSELAAKILLDLATAQFIYDVTAICYCNKRNPKAVRARYWIKTINGVRKEWITLWKIMMRL